MTEDSKISQRYRDLGREEPPRALDDAILAASRRAAATRPAPLVVPTGRQRWYFPLAAAAIIVLAVAVTLHVERERPDAEVVVQADSVAKAPAEGKAAQPAPAAPPPEVTVMREQQPAAAADQRARDQDRLESQRLAHERQRLAQERAGQEGARSQEMRRQSEAGVAASRPAPASRADEPAREPAALAKLAQQSPEQWLLGIDDLKRQGKHDEAEKQLAEFRKRYPNYRIPEAISEKFEKR
jgi:hypothetical protein